MITGRRSLVTGGAGFIGSHLTDRLLAEGWQVTVVDNFEPFYAPEAKRRNLAAHQSNPRFRLVEADIRDRESLAGLENEPWDAVVHLAAKAGVRASLLSPAEYQEVNANGTLNLLELTKRSGAGKFVFASSSSVYGLNPNVPWHEEERPFPISPYAASKAGAELLGHCYSSLYGIRFVALRLFSVYGPRQRPDLAIHRFARAMMRDQPFPFFGEGRAGRDYTFVDDIVSGIRAAMDYQGAQFEVFNLGSSRPLTLAGMVKTLEEILGIPAKLQREPAQAGDLPITYADIRKARALLGFEPRTDFREGAHRFIRWLRETEPL